MIFVLDTVGQSQQRRSNKLNINETSGVIVDSAIKLKAVEKVVPIHEAQLLTYLKLSGKKLGLLLNFNVLHMKDGIKRIPSKILTFLCEPLRTLR